VGPVSIFWLTASLLVVTVLLELLLQIVVR
jgi:hypothetical protein